MMGNEACQEFALAILWLKLDPTRFAASVIRATATTPATIAPFSDWHTMPTNLELDHQGKFSPFGLYFSLYEGAESKTSHTGT